MYSFFSENQSTVGGVSTSDHSIAQRFLDHLDTLQRYHVAFLVLLSCVARTRFIAHPDIIVLGWRQTDNASITINYLANGFRFLYPQVNWGGSGPGFVEMEFPLVQFLTAILYKVFGIHDIVAVIIPFLCSIGVVVVLYSLVRLLFDASHAVIAGTFVAISPMFSYFSQTFVGEPAILLTAVLGLHLLALWSRRAEIRLLIFGSLCLSLAVLLKLTALYLLVPALFVLFARFGRTFLVRSATWLMLLIVLVPVFSWYAHAHALYHEYHNTFGILAGGYNKFARMDVLTSRDFYSLIGGRIMFYILTPVVFVCMWFALFQRHRPVERYLFHVWLFALIGYLLVLAEGNKDMNYYQLPFLLPGAALGARGLIRLMEILGKREWFMQKPALLNGLFVLVLLSFFGAQHLFEKRSLAPFLESEREIRDAGRTVNTVTEPGSLIVVVTSYGDAKTPEDIDTPPQMFYFADRRGWYVASAWLNMGLIERLRRDGARYLVVAPPDAEEIRSTSQMYPVLKSRYPLVLDEPNCIVLDLITEENLHG
jgi:hypothetical protein